MKRNIDVKNAKRGVLLRTIKTVFSFYPRLFPLTVICIVFSGIVSSLPPVFMQKVIAIIEENFGTGDFLACSAEIFGLVSVLLVFYVLVIVLEYKKDMEERTMQKYGKNRNTRATDHEEEQPADTCKQKDR